MNWNCSACQTVNLDGDGNCLVCGSPRTAKGPIKPTVPVVTPSLVPQEQVGAPTAPPPPVPHSHKPWLVIFLVAVVAMLGAMVVTLLVTKQDNTATTTVSSPDDRVNGDDEKLVTTATSKSTAAPATVTETVVPETFEFEPRDTVPTVPLTVADVPAAFPMLETQAPNRWITMLYSLPKGDYTLAEADEQAASVARSQYIGQQVRLMDSDRNEHMNPGYWAIVVVGFDTRAEAIAMCDTFGIPRGDCYPRQPVTGET